MQANRWLKQSTNRLRKAGVGTARLDCLVLLEDETGKDRSWLLAHPEYELSNAQVASLGKKIEQRAKHIPLAYVRDKTEFYGREFYIDERVLEPRPESETMFELLKQLAESSKLKVPSKKEPQRLRTRDFQLGTIIDIGTGSGALAITAKLEYPEAKVIATDIDRGCLEVAQRNATAHKADIEFFEGDLLQPLSTVNCQLSTVLANLPYVPTDYALNEAAMNEPRQAIFGGQDGLDLYRKFFKQLAGRAQYVLTESLPFQHQALAEIAQQNGYQPADSSDFIQLFRLNFRKQYVSPLNSE